MRGTGNREPRNEAVSRAISAIDRDPDDAWSPVAARTCTISPSSTRSAGQTFYADGRSVRPQVENTVARGQLHEDSYFYTGMQSWCAKKATPLPFPSHDATVLANAARSGTTSSAHPATRASATVNRHDRAARLRQGRELPHRPPAGCAARVTSSRVITNGYGAMPDYSAQVTPELTDGPSSAYIRALQLEPECNTKPTSRPAQHVEHMSKYTTLRKARRYSPILTSPPSGASCQGLQSPAPRTAKNYVLDHRPRWVTAGGGSGQFPAAGCGVTPAFLRQSDHHETLRRGRAAPATPIIQSLVNHGNIFQRKLLPLEGPTERMNSIQRRFQNECHLDYAQNVGRTHGRADTHGSRRAYPARGPHARRRSSTTWRTPRADRFGGLHA